MQQEENNKAVLRQALEEIFNRGNLAAADRLIHPEYHNHSAAPGQQGGAAGVKHVARMYQTAFPDLKISIEELLCEGDLLTVRVTESGTHLGNLREIPPTGRKITWHWIGIYRVQEGRLIERWGDIESVGFMEQIMAPVKV